MASAARPALPPSLADELLAALGTSLPTNRAGVDQLYAAWVARVPFDPVAKALALTRGERPPGDDPVEVAERFLTTGLGSTCWGHVTVLQALLDRAGAPSTIGLDRMRIDLVDFHAFLTVEVDDRRFLLDPIKVSGGLLPLEPGARGDHPAYSVGVDAGSDGRLEHWFVADTPEPSRLTYVVLADDLDLDDVRTFLSISATHSGVGRTFFQRRAHETSVEHLRPTATGRALEHRTRTTRDSPWTTTQIDDLDEALSAARLHGPAIDHLIASRLLDPTSTTPWSVYPH